jgi:hypothetical protein
VIPVLDSDSVLRMFNHHLTGVAVHLVRASALGFCLFFQAPRFPLESDQSLRSPRDQIGCDIGGKPELYPFDASWSVH